MIPTFCEDAASFMPHLIHAPHVRKMETRFKQRQVTRAQAIIGTKTPNIHLSCVLHEVSSVPFQSLGDL